MALTVAADLVEHLRARLVPACPADVVAAALAIATDGGGPARRGDGRRASVLTPSGSAVEVSVSGGAGRAPAVLRYAAEPGSSSPFFGPRLAAQRRALARLAALLPSGMAPAGADVRALHDIAFPDPGAVAARTRFASFVGVVHSAADPDHLSGVKVYANLRAAGPDVLARLVARWPAAGTLADLAGGLVGEEGSFSLEMGAIEALKPPDAGVDASPRLKLYLRTCVPGPAAVAAVATLAERVGADAAALAAALAASGIGEDVWRRPVFACLTVDAADALDGAAPSLSVHLPARAIGLAPPELTAAVRRLATDHHAGPAVDALVEALASVGDGAAAVTVVGVGLAASGIAKVNVYAAPAA